MSVRTRLNLTLVTSSVSPSPARADSGLARVLDAVSSLATRVIGAPLVRRGLHNQDALLENQAVLARDPAAHARAATLRAAYADLEPVESRHLELIQLAAAADLYVEGRPWTVGFAPGALILVNRGTRLLVGRVAPALRKSLEARLPRG